MITLGRLLAFLIILWTSVQTVSYGIWTWKRKNRPGAIVVFILILAIIIIPVYKLFFKE